MGLLGDVNFDDPYERKEFNEKMEEWRNRQAFTQNLVLFFYLYLGAKSGRWDKNLSGHHSYTELTSLSLLEFTVSNLYLD